MLKTATIITATIITLLLLATACGTDTTPKPDSDLTREGIEQLISDPDTPRAITRWLPLEPIDVRLRSGESVWSFSYINEDSISGIERHGYACADSNGFAFAVEGVKECLEVLRGGS